MDEIYHEKQSMAFCALHAINNLLQHRAFTKMLLDDISHSLSPQQAFNPHRSILYVSLLVSTISTSEIDMRFKQAYIIIFVIDL